MEDDGLGISKVLKTSGFEKAEAKWYGGSSKKASRNSEIPSLKAGLRSEIRKREEGFRNKATRPMI